MPHACPPAQVLWTEIARPTTLTPTRPQGFIEFDVDEDDNYGKAGRVARRDREARKSEARQLSGRAGRELFLECLQVVLRKQVAWLVRERGLPAELEVAVRDLWDLRVRRFAGLKVVAAGRPEEGAGAATPSRAGSGSDSETTVYYTSQTESGFSSANSAATATSTASRARSWASEAGTPWCLPRLVDTLALCYLGCVLLRLPVRLGDLFHWAKQNQMPYLGAVSFAGMSLRQKKRWLNIWLDRRDIKRHEAAVAVSLPKASQVPECSV